MTYGSGIPLADPERQAIAAGFRQVARFDKTIRGHTDQFAYKFRKPKKAR